MKKYIRNILIFFVAVLVIDIAFGCVCRYLNSHAKGGDTFNHYDVAMNMKADVLMFGSSRCMHHYVPEIMSDTLGMSAYNCGHDGNGILFLYSRFQMIINRYNPKVIVYDIADTYDLAVDDHSRYLGWQRRFYDIPGVSEVFDDINPLERYKMYSQLYRYNSDFIQMLSDNIHPMHFVTREGFNPVYDKMDYEPEYSGRDTIPTIWDPLKKKYFEKFYQQCKDRDIKFIVAYSPQYHAQSIRLFTEMTEFCQQNKIPLINHYNDTVFSNNRNYFYDSTHMNVDGATEYTKVIAGETKGLVR